MKQKAHTLTEAVQQQHQPGKRKGRQHIQYEEEQRKQQAVEKSQKLITLSIDGVKSEITADDLESHFGRFGEVLEVTMATKKKNGNGYIIIRPT
ncbi:hypothetical protein AAHC03_05797 [Spirometra sp. Aus1]